MPNPNRPAVAIEFEGKTYPNRLSLARHLAALIGNSVRACESSLIRYKDDPTAVLEVFSRQRRPGAAFPVAVGGRPFRSKSAFYAYLRQHYGVSVD